jgi:endonuclease/exonuclease/phosphatase family metal-dependent hydrolase
MLLLTGCAASPSFLTYNVQNLFDAADDGAEYAEYRSENGWDEKAYRNRLARVERAVRAAASGHRLECIVLQEVESIEVAETLCRDYLRRWRPVGAPGSEPAQGAVPTDLESPPAAGATQVVILARREPEAVHTHCAAVVACAGSGGWPGDAAGTSPAAESAVRTVWRSRVMVEAVIPTSAGKVAVIGCHWKSQLGDPASSAYYRELEESLARSVAAANREVMTTLIIGDLNEPAGGAAGDSPHQGTPPAAGPPANGGPPGTYHYRGAWELIDRAILVPGPADDLAVSTVIVAPDFLRAADGTPFRYDPRRGRGYSDHLPLVATLSRSRTR